MREAKHKYSILLVDDHAMILDGVSRVINETKDFEVTGRCGSVKDALHLLSSQVYDILITDYNLPDQTGLALVKECRSTYPKMKILVLSMYDESHLVNEIIKEGINGYILKKDSLSELEKALYTIQEGNQYLSSDLELRLKQVDESIHPQLLLTPRERSILILVLEENSNRQIADTLFISERTVETHRKNIFRKTKTNNVIGLTKFAYKNNLII